MTRLPFPERHKVQSAEGEPYPLNTLCAHPDCSEVSTDPHHLVRRSELGGAYDWIEFDGVRVGNVLGLCSQHHDEITDNKAMILWNALGFFEWVIPSFPDDGHYTTFGRLDPQPPIGTPDTSGARYELPENPEICPVCKRPHRRKHTGTEPARQRRSWTISIPVDERENGADVLDTLLEEARRILAAYGIVYTDDKKARYYVMSAMLGLFVQHSNEVMR